MLQGAIVFGQMKRKLCPQVEDNTLTMENGSSRNANSQFCLLRVFDLGSLLESQLS